VNVRGLCCTCPLWLALCFGCWHRQGDPLEGAHVQFGVLFGGQIQERKQVPFELDPVQQTLALRIELERPLTEDTSVHWEWSKPGAPKGAARLTSPEDRTTEFGDEAFPKGQKQLDKVFRFKPGDNLGMWNIRVSTQSRVLLDRPLAVVAPRVHAASVHRDRDAGR
jgi:hypothetical protein